jgi:hypothetical protein
MPIKRISTPPVTTIPILIARLLLQPQTAFICSRSNGSVRKSKLYALPKAPGTYVAKPQAEYNVDGLVTGATYIPSKRVIALSGYKIAGLSFQPFIYLLYNYTGARIFSGNKRRLQLNPVFHQVEGIATIDGKQFFLTNEKLSNLITIRQSC